MSTKIWTLVTYENPENVVIIHTFAKITICADIIFAVHVVTKELTFGHQQRFKFGSGFYYSCRYYFQPKVRE